MKFTQFASLLQQVENTPGRNDMTVLLADFFKQLDLEETKEAMYMIQGRVAPQYEPIEFNFADKMALRAMQTMTEEDVTKLFGKLGDLGLVVETIVSQTQDGDNLEIR